MIRRAALEDIAAMHVVRSSVRENALSSPDVITHASYREMLARGGCGWVWEEAGRVVGFSVADLETRSLWALFVAPGHERQGIGRALLECAVAWLFDEGATSISLTTAPASRAETFYRTAGWRCVGTEPNGELRFELRRSRHSTR